MLDSDGFCIDGISIQVIEDGQSGKGPGYVLWDSAVVLAGFLETKEFPKDFFKGKRILELGSGCGLVGIACAIMGADVTMSDLPDVVPHTERNVRENSSKIAERGGKVQIITLDWRSDPKPDLGHFNLIFAADVAVSLNSTPIPEFVKTLKHYCSSDTVIYMTHKSRSDDVDRVLYTCFEDEKFDGEELSLDAQNPKYRNERIDVLHIVLQKP